LTANNEVSRIFIGETIPLTIGFSATQIVGTSATSSNTIAGTPITELRDIGQSLLITPSINADRTVTLRVVQENATRVVNGGKIPIVTPDGITDQPVDTVTRSTVSGTVVAKDGLAVVMGGLIDDVISDQRQKVPGLGKLPGLGFFFRRQDTGRMRRELIVMIRPYVFNTPTESAMQSQDLLQQLSVHPSALSGDLTLPTFCPDEVLQVDLDSCHLHQAFRFHNVVPRTY
jgi:general secretion pathway protein D